MKRNVFRLAAMLFALLLLAACGAKTGSVEGRTLEQSDVWKLGERYQANYSTLTYFVTYEANGEPISLRASRNAKQTGMSSRVRESKTEDGIVYALCESKQTDSDGKAAYTYYECYTGSFRYLIIRETPGFYIETVLSMDDAIALINAPESPKGKIKLCETEWNAQYRTDACNLEILIRPNDNGALIKSLSSSYQTQTENGETYYTASAGDDIVYTDGVSSVQIRQANRAGQNAQNYHTLDECKAILALLGTK